MEDTSHIGQESYFQVADGVWGFKDIFVNVYFVSTSNGWVLVDAGLKSAHKKIKDVARQLFGADVAPLAVVLTHGHFDHVGSIRSLLKDWNVPVYAHALEIPYLTGKSSYPPADSTVGGGLLSVVADLYPDEPIDLSGVVKSLSFNGEIPVLPDWRYIHTPGHSPGHISLWRETDKVLIVGDAFVTTKQESVLSTLMQIKILSGPPKYFTYDWQQAKTSVDKLAQLTPDVVATGHGKPMRGPQMQQDLMKLAADFEKKAIPTHGRYIANPAVTNKYGVVSLPPKTLGIIEKVTWGMGFLAMVGLGFALARNTGNRRKPSLGW